MGMRSAEQDRLARQMEPRVRRICRGLIGADRDWEDAAQLSLMQILASRDSFRGQGSLEAWCDRITVRTTLRWARRQRLMPLAEAGEVAEVPAAQPEMGLGLDVERLLAKLSHERRTVIILKHALGYRIAEIAQLTGVSENTVKDRLLHARRQLRKMVRGGSLRLVHASLLMGAA